MANGQRTAHMHCRLIVFDHLHRVTGVGDRPSAIQGRPPGADYLMAMHRPSVISARSCAVEGEWRSMQKSMDVMDRRQDRRSRRAIDLSYLA